jgi:hypothetical protein
MRLYVRRHSGLKRVGNLLARHQVGRVRGATQKQFRYPKNELAPPMVQKPAAVQVDNGEISDLMHRKQERTPFIEYQREL